MPSLLRLLPLLGLLATLPVSAQEGTPPPTPNTTRLFIQGSVDLAGVQAPVYGGMSETQPGFGRGLAVGYGFSPHFTLFGGVDFTVFAAPEEMDLDFQTGDDVSPSAGTAVLKVGARLQLPRPGSRLVPYADVGLALVGTAYQYNRPARGLFGSTRAETTTGGFGAFGGLGLQIAVTPEVLIRVGAEVLATRYTVFDDHDGAARSFDDPREGVNGALRVGVVAYPFR